MSQARLHSERLFHDRQAAERAKSLRPHDYLFSDDAYLQHESWIAPAFDTLGDLRGKRVLDLGCGHGMASVVLARRGADVVACDLSLGYLREARVRTKANDVQIRLLVCNGERLPFADGFFDRIWGNAILHHLDLRQAARELERVLAPGGRAVFCEPWGGNRWLSWARNALPYAGKQRTADEAPLGRRDLKQLRAMFPNLQLRGYQLLSMLGRVVQEPHLLSGLTWCDAVLLKQIPGWQRYCRYVVVSVAK
jgi:SAM-dependent methyltransferase